MGSISSHFTEMLQTIGVEAYSGRDGQGAPSYAPSVDVLAVLVRDDKLVRLGSGDDVRTTLTLIIDGDEDYYPSYEDRVTLSGETFIIVSAVQVRTLSGDVDHIECSCREE
jgi:hypothetical protein